MLEQIKAEVCQANLDLVAHGLVTLTWGNASALSEDGRHVVIKPSGVPYDQMLPEHMAVVDLAGNLLEGDLRPSSDTATHLILYQRFSRVRGITHTHSLQATTFAQARREIPCLGTTHADHFYGSVPVTRPLTRQEVGEAYEVHTGNVIVERFQNLDPLTMPAVLVAGHAPFTWGRSVASRSRMRWRSRRWPRWRWPPCNFAATCRRWSRMCWRNTSNASTERTRITGRSELAVDRCSVQQ